MKKIFVFAFRLIKWGCFAIGAICVLVLFLLVMVGWFAGHQPLVKDRSIMVMDLANGITDRPDAGGGGLSRLIESKPDTISLREVTTSLRAAAKDKRVAAVYLRGSMSPSGYESGFAALKEVREALMDFRKSGKPVIAYVVDPNQRDLYLVSAADQIWMNPSGVMEFHGLAVQGTFYKGAADKYGVEFQPIRHGKYKSAIEPFLREDYSAENREQLGALFGSVWTEMLQGIASARQVKSEALQAIADNEMALRVDRAKEAGLINGTAYEADMLEKLRKLAGVSDNKFIPQITLAEYADLNGERSRHAAIHSGNKIAVIYAEGEIKDGSQHASGGEDIYGDDFARMLRKVREDEDVKAVVLRINSPGGSSTASDVILDELRRLQKTRPVVVSMGTVAASGGYMIAMAGDRIFAEPNTITGSIGVFGMSLNIKKLANDHGVSFDVVKTAAHADSGTLYRPMDEFERLKTQDLIDSIYKDFLKDVATSRNMTTAQVDELGQGRVWSGSDALKHGLVDELGGLDAAVAEAAKRAKLEKFHVVEYPRSDFLKRLLADLSGKPDPLGVMGLPDSMTGELRTELNFLKQFNSPAGVYARLPFDINVR
jgi:protease-4